jgi:hypothetical protein
MKALSMRDRRAHSVSLLFIAFVSVSLASPTPSGVAGEAARTKPGEAITDSFPVHSLTRAEELAACLALWEPSTHMTKPLWMVVCKRIDGRH